MHPVPAGRGRRGLREPDDSAFPAAVLRYTVVNESDNRARVTLMWSLLNIAGDTNTYRKAGTDTLFKLPKSESVPVFRFFLLFF